MRSPRILLFILTYILVFYRVAHTEDYDYCWREYVGDIPVNAVAGGLGKNNSTTYVGQVFIDPPGLKPGILAVSVHKGRTTVTAELHGPKTVDKFIKVLCSTKPENFEWISAKATDLHLVTIGKHLVAGGAYDGRVLYIGRLEFQGELVIGQIVENVIGQAIMYFPFDGNTKTADSYQVLIYNEKFPKINK